jgi:hypothetical protein
MALARCFLQRKRCESLAGIPCSEDAEHEVPTVQRRKPPQWAERPPATPIQASYLVCLWRCILSELRCFEMEVGPADVQMPLLPQNNHLVISDAEDAMMFDATALRHVQTTNIRTLEMQYGYINTVKVCGLVQDHRLPHLEIFRFLETAWGFTQDYNNFYGSSALIVRPRILSALVSTNDNMSLTMPIKPLCVVVSASFVFITPTTLEGFHATCPAA